MTILPPPVASLPELMVLARGMEEEAARRYRALADRMRLRGRPDLQRLFEFLASIEQKHAREVDERAAAAFGGAPVREAIPWDVPENFDEEEGSSHLLTPYRALAIAVRNEERAFAFYSYLAANVADDGLRAMAEDFAKEELSHAWLLRRERRKAYRAEQTAPLAPRPDDLPGSARELEALAAVRDWEAASQHRYLAETLREPPEAARLFADAAADEEEAARHAAARAGFRLPDRMPPTARTVEDGLRLLEEAFEIYADIAQRTDREAVMHEAQRLAARALRRLATVQGSIRNSLMPNG